MKKKRRMNKKKIGIKKGKREMRRRGGIEDRYSEAETVQTPLAEHPSYIGLHLLTPVRVCFMFVCVCVRACVRGKCVHVGKGKIVHA